MANNTLQDSKARRRRNNGVLEIKGPNGAARVVALDELNQDDAELAVNFGYNPVLKRVSVSSSPCLAWCWQTSTKDKN
jgi:hypothetical protein